MALTYKNRLIPGARVWSLSFDLVRLYGTVEIIMDGEFIGEPLIKFDDGSETLASCLTNLHLA